MLYRVATSAAGSRALLVTVPNLPPPIISTPSGGLLRKRSSPLIGDFEGGNLISMKPRYNPIRSSKVSLKGRKITSCTKSAMRRLMEDLAKLDKTIPAYTFALTYGDKFPDASQARKDVNKLNRWIAKRFSDLGLHYKREPQKRGATHFHYLFQNSSFSYAKFASEKILRKWCDIANLRFGEDQMRKSLDFHLYIDPVESRRGTDSDRSNFQVVRGKNFFNYLGKYMSKGDDSMPDGYDLEGGGKWWGRVNRKSMMYVEEVMSEPAEDDSVMASRVERTFYKLRQKRAQVASDRATSHLIQKTDLWSFNGAAHSFHKTAKKMLLSSSITPTPKRIRKLTRQMMDSDKTWKKARKIPRVGEVKIKGNTEGISEAINRMVNASADFNARANIFGDDWTPPKSQFTSSEDKEANSASNAAA